MALLGNIFLDSLNTIISQANYSENVAMFQNSRLIMANNPEYGVENTKVYINPIICGQTICGSDCKVEK
jgi:hypothetical protein